MAERIVWVIEHNGVPGAAEVSKRKAFDMLGLAGMLKANELVRYVPASELDAARAEVERLRSVVSSMGDDVDGLASSLETQRAEVERLRAQLECTLDASREGAWMARALDAETERDAAREERETLRTVLHREREVTTELALQLQQARAEAERMKVELASANEIATAECEDNARVRGLWSAGVLEVERLREWQREAANWMRAQGDLPASPLMRDRLLSEVKP